MNCEESRRLLNAFADNELELTAAMEIQLHLEGCAECRQRVESLREMAALVRERAPTFETPGYFRTRIRASLGAEKKPPIWIAIFRMNWALPATFAILLAVGVIYLKTRAPDTSLADEAIADHVRSLQVNHLRDVVSTDQHTVKPWFSGKLDYSPTVVDLATDGFPLVGGRLDVLGHRNVAALIYQRRAHYINLFTWPGNDPGAMPQQQHGYNVRAWSAGGMNYVAISDVQAQELDNFVSLLKTRTQ
jgi:anti-sigma factor RsiW